MRIEFDASIPIYPALADLWDAFQQEGLPLRLIGGIAMLTHLAAYESARGFLTQDFDVVIDRKLCATADSAKDLARKLRELRTMLRFVLIPKSSRLKECRFQHAETSLGFEQLCGTLDVGKVSDQSPAKWRIVKNELYAAHVPALDWLADEAWIDVEARIERRTANYLVPSISGMYLLKIQAVSDKIDRTAATQSTHLEHELGQLVKHARDLVLLAEMARVERLAPLAGARDESSKQAVRQVARSCHRRLLDTPLWGHPDLADFTAGSHKPLLDALEL